MRLLLSDNEGNILDEIIDVEQWNLNKPIARASLIDEIRRMISIGEVKLEQERKA